MKKIFYLFLAPAFLFSAKSTKAQSEVTFYTSMGTFVATMYDTLQPITAGNFISLVDTQFYDGIIFHRVIQNFMIQGGDPLGNGTGGPGYTIPDEFDPNTHNVVKAIAMANAGPNTGGSQFFINLVNNLYLDPDYPVFGIVNTGFSVVQSIGAVATNGNDKPLVDVVMDSVRVTSPMTSNDYFSGETPLIEIYPNPVVENSVFKIKATSTNIGSVSIYNQMGTSVYYKALQLNGNVVELTEIKDLNLSAGIYYFVVTDGVTVSQKKFVVLK